MLPSNAIRVRLERALRAQSGSFCAAIEDGLQILNVDSPDRLVATDKTALSDYITRAIPRHVPAARVIDSAGGKECVLLRDRAVIRVKAVNVNDRARNIPTRRHLRYVDQHHIEGIPADLPRVDLCYRLDPQQRAILGAKLIYRTSRVCLFEISLPWAGARAAGAITLDLGLPTSTVRVSPRIAAEHRARRERDA